MEQLLERLRMSFSLKPHPLGLEAPDQKFPTAFALVVLRAAMEAGVRDDAAESSAGDMGGSAVAERLDDRLEQIRPLSTSRRALLTSRSIQRSSLPSPSHLSSLRLRRHPLPPWLLADCFRRLLCLNSVHPACTAVVVSKLVLIILGVSGNTYTSCRK